MAEQYNPKKAEKKWKEYWKKEKIYKFDSKRKGEVFSVDTPPPYISGRMHIGHAFSYSQQDFIIRFRRMIGSVFYPFGTDDNGLPTERFIEKLNKIKSKNMSRAKFISLCLKTLKKETPDCIEDFKTLGISADYNIYYSTIDKPTQKISQMSFIDLFEKGFVYQKEFPTLWCPECQTSIAQAELEDKQEDSLFFTLKFGVDDKNLLIATTRPELLPACVAVFVHPNDKRYKDLIGKKAKIPLFDFKVPIIADKSADMKKGTGVLMVCSYGDKFDVEAINRYNLTPKLILNSNGTLNFGKYRGMKIKEARRKILEDLRKASLIKGQKKIEHVVNVHDKCGTGIEFITARQWFIKILDKKKRLIEQGEKIKWHPKFMFKRYKNWVNGLEWDWSVSRERHFGVPIPVWECKKCKEIILADKRELPVDPIQIKRKCGRCKEFAEPETKVLDTWATSSLTPQIASSLVNNKIKIPFSLRPQAHDIIRTWAFYTIVKSLYHENKIPWKDIVISGFVTSKGKKMSKSKGTGVQPRDVFEKYGADALRFWAAGSKLGEDLDYQEKDLITGKKFIIKLFNASRFVFMNLKNYKIQKPSKLEKIDDLFLRKLNSLIKKCTNNFKNYEYSKVKADVERFFWHDFADNYLEIVKKRIYNGTGNRKISAQYTLYKSLLNILKLIAPIMPFITEEIYQNHFKKFEKEKSIHLTKWPEFGKESNTDELELFISILSKVRQEKTKAKKSMNVEIILSIDKKYYDKLEGMIEDLKDVANAKEIKTGKFGVEFVNK
jgi:valyl-tRNA synthetase